MTPRFARIGEAAIRCRDMSAADWRVYGCISLHADADGRAYPGMTTIAVMTGIRRQDVPRTIRRLERLGMLRCNLRGGPKGTNAYTLIFDDDEVSATVRTVCNGADSQSVRNGADGGVRRAATKVSATLRRKQTIEQTNEHICAEEGKTAEWFNTFWRVYPSRGGHNNPKKPAREKYLAAIKRGIDPEMLNRAAANYAAHILRSNTAGRYVKEAQFWLSQECWEQYADPIEAEPLRAGMI